MTKRLKIKETAIGEGGEILYSSQQFVANGEDAYFKPYENADIVYIDNSHLAPVFTMLARMATYVNKNVEDMIGQQTVCVNCEIRRKIGERCHISEKAVMKNIKKLMDLGAVRRVSTGIYQLNPNFIGKGAWVDIVVARERYDAER